MSNTPNPQQNDLLQDTPVAPKDQAVENKPTAQPKAEQPVKEEPEEGVLLRLWRENLAAEQELWEAQAVEAAARAQQEFPAEPPKENTELEAEDLQIAQPDKKIKPKRPSKTKSSAKKAPPQKKKSVPKIHKPVLEETIEPQREEKTSPPPQPKAITQAEKEELADVQPQIELSSSQDKQVLPEELAVPTQEQADVVAQEKLSRSQEIDRVEADSIVRKKRGFLFFVTGTFVFTVGCALFVFVLFMLSQSSMLSSRQDVDLPNFYGMTQEQIESNSAYSNFSFDFQYVYNEEIKEGVVYYQTPKPPKQVKENAHIILRVSQGVQRVAVPNILNSTREDAEASLKEAGLNVLLQPVADKEQEIGIVVDCEPAVGTVLDAGDVVTIYVTREAVSQSTKVPDCIELTETAAQDLLRNKKLGAIVREVESTAPAGTVVWQSPSAGVEVQRGTSITLHISGSGEGGPVMAEDGSHMHTYVTSYVQPGPVSIGGNLHTCSICGYFYMTNVVGPTG